MSDPYPRRIVCLTEETTETLYLLGQGDRVVGVSGYTVRPPEARRKPKVSAFISARFEAIEALEPDLVLAFSDLQADLAAELVRRGLSVVTFNQRSVPDILQMIRMLGGLVGCQAEAADLTTRLSADLARIRESAARFPSRHRTFFEEWDEPLISGIRWVEEVARRDPDIIFASWCGKRVRPATIRNRPAWNRVKAVVHDRIFEIKSTYILQPGPASLSEGVRQLHAVFARVHGIEIDAALTPQIQP
jgi:iron complex transport system substrate-binding protein